MTDSTPDAAKNRRTVDGAVFARFLEALAADAEEAHGRYLRLQKKLVGFFRLRGVSDPASAADETLDRAAYRIFEGATVPDPERFCVGVARNIVKERLRREQREHTAFVSFLEDRPDSADGEVERIQHILKPCFEQLADKDQKLMLAYCQVPGGRARAEHRRRVALEMGMTMMALRMRVTRLRSVLDECVRLRAAGGH